ncbi:hypothetical protein D3C76_382790 [compost metagenome]
MNVGRGFQQVDIALLEHEAVIGVLDGRGDDIGALHGPVFLQGQLHARHGARHTHRLVTTGAELRDDIAILVQVHVGGGSRWRLFAEIEERLAAIGQLDGHEATATQVTRRQVGHRQRIANSQQPTANSQQSRQRPLRCHRS